MKIVVCCSMTQMYEANKLKDRFKMTGDVVIPKSIPENTTLTDHRRAYYDEIAKADLVIILTKPDGTIGDSVSHELAFAKYSEIPYLVIGIAREELTRDDLRNDLSKTQEHIETLSYQLKELKAGNQVIECNRRLCETAYLDELKQAQIVHQIGEIDSEDLMPPEKLYQKSMEKCCK